MKNITIALVVGSITIGGTLKLSGCDMDLPIFDKEPEEPITLPVEPIEPEPIEPVIPEPIIEPHVFAHAGDTFTKQSSVLLVDLDPPENGFILTATITPQADSTRWGRIISKANGLQEHEHWLMFSIDTSGNKFALRLRVKASNKTDTLQTTHSFDMGKQYDVKASYSADTKEMKIYVNDTEAASRLHSVGGKVTQNTTMKTAIGSQPDGQERFVGEIKNIVLDHIEKQVTQPAPIPTPQPPVGNLEAKINYIERGAWITETDLSILRGYAPHGVFFDGFSSTPNFDDITKYEWNMGDGIIKEGVNVSHVYETPGVYNVSLSVYSGTQKHTKSLQVQVLEPNGVTYYVDSSAGCQDNINYGKSQAQPWCSASFAIQGVYDSRYKMGDRILFRRGREYQVNLRSDVTGHHRAGRGYGFGAYGTGANPKWIANGNGGTILPAFGANFNFISFSDIDIELDHKGSFFESRTRSSNVLFNRITINKPRWAIYVNGSDDVNLGLINFHLNKVNVHDCTSPCFYIRAFNFAFTDSNIDYSANHLIYVSHLSSGIFKGNTLKRAAAGRTALRVSGASNNLENPSRNVYIANNHIEGWIDPRTGQASFMDGTRYNWLLLHIGNNTPDNQRIKNVIIENNFISNGESLVSLANENIRFRNNKLHSQNNKHSELIILGSKHGWDYAPLYNVRIENNEFNLQLASKTDSQWFYYLREYKRSPYKGRTNHSDIVIRNNKMNVVGEMPQLIKYEKYSDNEIIKFD